MNRTIHRLIGLGATALLVGIFGVMVWHPWVSIATETTALASRNCTIRGTNGDDVLSGTGAKDRICARRGKDYAAGNGNADVLKGAGGDDTLVGNNGRDVLRGGSGDDRLFAVDGRTGDVLRGGTGDDDCYADFGDIVRGCEETHRGGTIAATKAISESFFAVVQEAVEQIETGPPPTTVTETVTATAPPGTVTQTVTAAPVTVTVTVTATIAPQCGNFPSPCPDMP